MTEVPRNRDAWPGLDREHLDGLHHMMVRIREFENAAAKQLATGKLSGTLHLSSGQEAVAAGVCSALERADYVTSTHRGHGHCLAKGADPRRMMAELFGAESGYCKGRSGSMHIADSTTGLLGANGIVGGGFGMTIGGALTAQVTKSGSVSVTFFGEGATGEGSLHECLNLAALWRLPVIFVCENNGYAELSPVSDVLSAHRVADLGTPFGIPSGTHDGNDVAVVAQAAAAAVARGRRGDGPTLLEFVTYRQDGHYVGDAQTYRTKQERAEWAQQDPIDRSRDRLIGLGASADGLEHVRARAVQEMSDAAEWASGQPPAPASSMTTDIYDESVSWSSATFSGRRVP